MTGLLFALGLLVGLLALLRLALIRFPREASAGVRGRTVADEDDFDFVPDGKDDPE